MLTHQQRQFITLMITAISLVLFTVILNSAQEATPTPSDYVDLQFSEIRGLTEEQITGYRTGAGMGFALPAELNGYPGPRHVLDLADELELNDEQLTKIREIFVDMTLQAIPLGEAILAQESAIELAFRDQTITDEFLITSLTESGRLEVELRYVHLSSHLATLDILTEHQVVLYNQLRGYDDNAHEQEAGGHNHNH